jgi:hypothetical protein
MTLLGRRDGVCCGRPGLHRGQPAAFIAPQEVPRYRYDIGLYKSDPLAVSRTASDVRFLWDAASDCV